MRWGDKIYVVAAIFLKSEHDFGQIFRTNRLSLSAVAYVEVLAKITEKVAVREKNSP
jgi:hypothetical protein